MKTVSFLLLIAGILSVQFLEEVTKAQEEEPELEVGQVIPAENAENVEIEDLYPNKDKIDDEAENLEIEDITPETHEEFPEEDEQISILGEANTNYQTSTVNDTTEAKVYKRFKTFLGKSIRDAKHNFVIPGLGQNFVPQGFGETKDWFLVASYYSKYGSSAKQNSKLYIISKSTGKVSKVLTLSTSAHVGGVAASSKNVYVCVGSQIGKIAVSTISKTSSGKTVKFAKMYNTKTTCSFASYFDGKLFTGKFNEKSTAKAYAYTVGTSSLTVKATYTIPKKVQGFTVVNKTMIAVSQSYGRNTNSSLILYKVSNAYNSVNLPKQKTKKYVLPPMSEGIFTGADGNLYVIFESGANYYFNGPRKAGKSFAKYPMDKVVAVSKSKL